MSSESRGYRRLEKAEHWLSHHLTWLALMGIVNSIDIFEHEQIDFPWNDKDLRAIEKLNSLTGNEVIRATVRGSQHVLQAKEQVGLLRFGNYSINVLPKIYQSRVDTDRSSQAKQATRNLLHLLAFAGQIPIKEQTIANLLSRKMDWFEILTRLFASHLGKEWQLGVYRTYRSTDAHERVLKGKWNISQHIMHPDQQHIFPVTYDEFTVDNALNRVFRFVVERLLRLTRDAENRRILSILSNWLDDVSVQSHLTVHDTDHIVFTRLNQRFEPLLNLAKLFLDDSAMQLSSGDKSSFAFIFDMNLLYEAFVVNFIRSYRERILSPYLLRCDILPQANGATHYLAYQQSRKVFKMKPDIVFRDQGEYPILVDTKYKRLDPNDTRLGVSQADFYQMYAYSQSYKSKRVILLYPQTVDVDSSVRTQFLLENGKQEVQVETLDVRVDLGSSNGKQYLINQLRNIFGE
jgi:5-methylcytosine-specific restriction enzyme subunit McrC